ncbi:unnamed protein product [Porites evermanni]|uniref:Uncharacterized protein n=1 Tax=Porites evermanni TaxID=104178 RepID=A0ABN8SP57_9CNID|nr:unnamed protein product [Porites evermanni]
MNHLRLVMATFPPCTYGLHADEVTRKDRQKWEVVQRLKFLSVQTCLLNIAHRKNGVTKDVSVYGTWAFLYVAWHYTEIFFSLHASLRERIKYAAFLAIFFSFWRNWIVISNAFSLKQNFLTRECFQDVLLSCHFVVILISYFRDEHPDLECPLHLTGSHCCERYFSKNGSFVQNRHNYTFLDMHTNLGHMNRLEEIKATNPDIKFPIRKHNNINEQGDETSDDDKWFYKPMEYVDFKKSLRGMETEEEQETLRREAREQESEEATETETGPNSDSLCDSFEDEEVEDIHQIVNPLLDSFNKNKEAEKRGATLLIPGISRRYKSTIIAELRNNPELSTDRLRRVRGAGTSSESEKTGDNDSTDSGDSVALFDDCVFYDPTCAGKFVLGRVQRHCVKILSHF